MEDSRNRHILKLKAGFNNYSSLYLSAAFPCNRTKQPARTLRVSFALVALSRRPWLWPVTVRRRLNSGRPAYSSTTSYFIFISILHMSKADSYKRQRGRPKPGPTAQNKPRELDPKGSHGLLCAHLRRKCGKSVGGPGLRAFTCSVSNPECETLGHANLPLRTYMALSRGPRSTATDLRPHECASE